MPTRTCVGCRSTDEKTGLVRLVVTKEGRVRIDAKHRLPGRGAYVHGSRACVDEAIRTGGLARSFRRKTQPLDAAKLFDELNEELANEQQ
jgi:predicted RNA-binding protein YlxR (DUF448 family)